MPMAIADTSPTPEMARNGRMFRVWNTSLPVASSERFSTGPGCGSQGMNLCVPTDEMMIDRNMKIAPMTPYSR